MLEDIQLRNLSAGTQRSYIHYVTGYATHYKLSPARLGLDDIRNYQLHLIDQRQLSPNSINGFLSAVQFLYTVTLDMPWSKTQFGRMKVPEKLPVALSEEEVLAFFRQIGILKHRAVLMLCYGSGLRIAEAVSLKAENIDSKRMLIHVQMSKTAKTPRIATPRLAIALSSYCARIGKCSALSNGCFPAPRKGRTSSRLPSRNLAGRPLNGLASSNAITPHVLRHSFATHLLESAPIRAPFRSCPVIAASKPPLVTPPSRHKP